ncbi:MAG: AAA family ATPase [Candidatus Devosia phytovorans]|uniref:AAA family ATPase n=1 Tax=Candidatus Devosia phytovorans TaxID=3121372 RepID=A0AAJ5VT59_9HYPH|nr:AAA family ATPase [Devosia sp.]WEK03867.1 MAG: AAA family ATPase [Devosia sp.]
MPNPPGDFLELLHDNWDDFGFETTFHAKCVADGETLDLAPLRILVKDETTTADTWRRLVGEGWDGVFPAPGIDYVTVPSDVTFYQQLEAAIGIDRTVEVAAALRDASYLVHVSEDEEAIALTKSTGFKDSLQRERGSVKAFIDSWKILRGEELSVLDMGFRFDNVRGKRSLLELRFQSDSPLPHDINVLIGPNGYGKSSVLHQMVEDWTASREFGGQGFVDKPNLSQIVVVSYSPFERFPVDLSPKRVKDVDAYRYFGFRGRSVTTDGKPGRIRISNDFPRKAAAGSLLDCLADDHKYSAIRGWSKKLHTVEKVLKTAIDFDFAALEMDLGKRAKDLYDPQSAPRAPFSYLVGDDPKRRYFPVSSSRVAGLDLERLKHAVVTDSGVAFFKDGEPVELSSGQRLFAYLVVNVVGAIKRNSLILVDEPELFLHPTLEVQFVGMLKGILKRFNSKALLATHSVVTVREIPADCVHVFERSEDDVLVRRPPFQTFGGDVQRISSYVFGDGKIAKPFQNWIETQLEARSASELIAALGDEVNEELILQIRAMDRA